MNRHFENFLRAFFLELIVYSALVAAYYFLVLHFLGHWLFRIFTQHRGFYAAVALGLIIGQGFLLEMLTRFLLSWVKAPTEEQ